MAANNPLLTKRDKAYFRHGGYLFYFQKMSSDTVTSFWHCWKRKPQNCPARIHVKDNIVVKQLHEHVCESAPESIAAISIVNNIKKRAVETQELPNTLMNYAIKEAPQSVLASVPKYDAIRKTVQRSRNLVSHAPANPLSLSELVIPEIYKTFEGEPFLLIDTGPEDSERILVFGKNSYSSWAHQVDRLYVDGTFSIAPPLFAQLFEIFVERGSYVFPLFFALLPNKTQRTYTRLFELICNLRPEMNPQSVATDFEQGLINAVRSVWPNVQIHGCLFHLCQSFNRNIASNGLKAQYDTDPDFRMWAKCIPALAFYPITELHNGFDSLTQEMPENIRESLQDVLDYFEDNYLGRPGRNNTRRSPKFLPETWSVYNRVLNDENRTNNFAEGGHRRIQIQLGMTHPTIWKFIDGLKAVQKNRDKVYAEFLRGETATQKRRQFRDADNRIKLIVEDNLENRTPIEYLQGIASNFATE